MAPLIRKSTKNTKITRSTGGTRSTGSTGSTKRGCFVAPRAPRNDGITRLMFPLNILRVRRDSDESRSNLLMRHGTGASRISVLILFIIPILLVLLAIPIPVYAWGSITHVAICRHVSSSAEYQAGGHSPDIIALNSVTTGSDAYDYAHNLDGPAGAFGQLMDRRGGGEFGRGWLCHQLADSIVHRSGGYSVTKTVFKGLPDRYRADLDHGATELIVDAIVLEDEFGGQMSFQVPDKSRLIHETSVDCFNSVGGRIPRRNIISCRIAESLTSKWEGWLITNLYLAELMLDEPWFAGVKNEYLDYRPFFDKSIALAGSELAYVAPASSRQQPNILTGITSMLLPAKTAFAAEDNAGEKTSYYSFVTKLSERARAIGQGKITKESVRQAISEMENTPGLTDREKVWAKATQEMTVKHNRDFGAIERNVAAYGKESASKQGASGGRTGAGFLPCLPPAILCALIVSGGVWLGRRILDGR